MAIRDSHRPKVDSYMPANALDKARAMWFINNANVPYWHALLANRITL